MIDVSYTEPAPKVVVNEFPYIVKRNTLLVLFTKQGDTDTECEGVVISSSTSIFPIGHISKSWLKSEFHRFDGPVTLQNKVDF